METENKSAQFKVTKLGQVMGLIRLGQEQLSWRPVNAEVLMKQNTSHTCHCSSYKMPPHHSPKLLAGFYVWPGCQMLT